MDQRGCRLPGQDCEVSRRGERQPSDQRPATERRLWQLAASRCVGLLGARLLMALRSTGGSPIGSPLSNETQVKACAVGEEAPLGKRLGCWCRSRQNTSRVGRPSWVTRCGGGDLGDRRAGVLGHRSHMQRADTSTSSHTETVRDVCACISNCRDSGVRSDRRSRS